MLRLTLNTLTFLYSFFFKFIYVKSLHSLSSHSSFIPLFIYLCYCLFIHSALIPPLFLSLFLSITASTPTHSLLYFLHLALHTCFVSPLSCSLLTFFNHLLVTHGGRAARFTSHGSCPIKSGTPGPRLTGSAPIWAPPGSSLARRAKRNTCMSARVWRQVGESE